MRPGPVDELPSAAACAAALGRRALPQALLLVVLGALAGWILNQTRTNPLPLDLPPALLLAESGARPVSLSVAVARYDEGEYVFLDARPAADFVAEHIAGAFSLPADRFAELHGYLQDWTAGQPLLIYGSAADPVSVDDLARRLIKAGEEDVLILAGGIEGWARRDYPLDTGREGLLDEE